MKSLVQLLIAILALSLLVAVLAVVFVSQASSFISADGALAAFASAGFLLTVLADYQRTHRQLRPAVYRRDAGPVASLTPTH